MISVIQIIRNNESDPKSLLGVAPMIERQIIQLKKCALDCKDLIEMAQVVLKMNSLKYNSIT
jgi:hypothetical protein